MNSNLNFDAIKELGLDVWEDLSRTRLAGVAIGLGLAILVIGVLLLRPTGTPNVAANSEIAAATAVPAADDEVTFTVPGEKPLKMTNVDLSAPRDPFRSLDGMAGVNEDQTLMPADEDVQKAISTFSGEGGGVSTAGYDDTSSLVPLDDLSGADSDTTMTTDTTDSEDTTETTQGDVDADEPREPAEAPVTDYSYAADIQFGLVNDLERYSRVQRLGLVPSRKLPLLMYLGVTADHTTAVFMVDSRLSQGGEGRCVPKASLCTFLEMRPTPEQDEHHFRDADGNEYLLRLRRLVRTDTASGSLNGRSVSELDGSPPVVDGTR